MKILITLFFNSEFGGLHDNIRATALEAARRGHDVYVACRSGLFFDQLDTDGINVIEIDYDDIEQSVRNIIEEAGSGFDLIHAHPGASRKVAMKLHHQYHIPVIYHIHGAWLNAVEEYIDELACVFTVSESVKQKVVERTGGNAHKIHVIPNYSDYIYEKSTKNKKASQPKRISLITRLEKDKENIIDEVKKLTDYFNQTHEKVHFDIIGEGSLKENLIEYLNEQIESKRVKVNSIDWISDKKKLKKHIVQSDVVIGPGRVAIDAYTLRTPVIVVGSQNYLGLINKQNWQYFVSANFGGYGANPDEGDIAVDLEALLTDEAVYEDTVKIGSKVVDLFFNKEKTLEKMFGIYEIVTKN
jgi:glycosyltransferase involved in cell wall biosynthesis